MSIGDQRSAQRALAHLYSTHASPPSFVHPHDLPPSSRSPSPSKQGAIFEPQQQQARHSHRPAHGRSVSTPASPTSPIVGKRRYGADQRMRNTSISGDDWALGLDRVDSPGPPSFGVKGGRGAGRGGSQQGQDQEGYGGYPSKGMTGKEKEWKMPIVIPASDRQAGSQRDRDTRTPPRLSSMPPPPSHSPSPSANNTPTGPPGPFGYASAASGTAQRSEHGPAVHVTHPSMSTTASYTQSMPQRQRSAAAGYAPGPGSFADVVKTMQEAHASRENVQAAASVGKGQGGANQVDGGSTGRPPKKRQNLIGPGGMLANMASKPSFARLRQIATASKDSLKGKSKVRAVSADSTAGSAAALTPYTNAKQISPSEPGRETTALASQQADVGPSTSTDLERRTTILRPAPPPPPLRSSGPSTGRFAAPATPGLKGLGLTGRSSGLLTNASSAVVASSSTDALFAPPTGSNPNLQRSASASATMSPLRTQDTSVNASWLHNPHVNVSAGAEVASPNMPLAMRVSRQTTADGDEGGFHRLKRSVSVREDGTVEIPRFKRKELNLGLVPCGLGRGVVWMALWAWCVLWVLAGLFFDANILYMLVQCVQSPGFGSAAGSSNSGWVFALAADGTCMFISTIVVWLGWGVWYESWRKWRLPQPPIEPIHMSLPATVYLSLSSFPHFCFFLHTRLSMLGTKYASDILPETAHLGLQTIPALLPVLPRASIAVILYVTFYTRSNGVPLHADKDPAFWAENGRLTGYARGVVLAFVLVSAIRLAIALISGVVILLFSRSRYSPSAGAGGLGGLSSVTQRGWRHQNRPSLVPLSSGSRRVSYTEDTKAGQNEVDPTTPRRTRHKERYHKRDPSETLSPSKGWTAEADLAWGWRERGRNRLQDAYELCMLRPSRRRSGRSLASASMGMGSGILSPSEVVEKLASPNGTRGEDGRLLGRPSPSPTPIRVRSYDYANGANRDVPMPRSTSPGKRSATPTIRFAGEQASSRPPLPGLHSQHHGHGGVYETGRGTEAARSSGALKAPSEAGAGGARPESGILPKGASPPRDLLAAAGMSGGLVLGAPIKETVSDPQISQAQHRSDIALDPNYIPEQQQATPSKRPPLAVQGAGSQASKESLSSHEMFYTPLTQTPVPSTEGLAVSRAADPAGLPVLPGDAVESIQETRGNAPPSATVHSASADIPNAGRPSTSHSARSDSTADDSDATALLSYDDFGYPSYPARGSRSPKKRQYGPDALPDPGMRSVSPVKGTVRAVISSPSLKNLRERDGSIVGRKGD